MKKYMLIVLLMILCLFPGFKIQAADYKKVSGTFNYDYAFEVLKLVNVERKKEGVPPLSMDKSMLNSAMVRAAEITVVFNHVRPNGGTCFSINKKIYGENIAFGQSSPADVMKSWMNSQGHKANILNSSYKSIGVGCMTCSNGVFWVQVFGFDEAEDVKCPQNENVTCKVSLNSAVESSVDEVKNVSEESISCKNSNEENEYVLPKNVKGVKAHSGNKKITVKWKNSRNIDGYELQISNNKKYKDLERYYFTDTITKLNISFLNGKRLESHKKYYVRVRSFTLNDYGIRYSKWKKKTIRVK